MAQAHMALLRSRRLVPHARAITLACLLEACKCKHLSLACKAGSGLGAMERAL